MGTPANAVQVWRFGVFELDARSGELRRNGSSIKLREQSSRILIYLLENAGQMVTREELRRVLWPSDTFVDFDHSLNTAVMKLREALGDSADAPLYIETIPKRGYRFIAPVSPAPPTAMQVADANGGSPPIILNGATDATVSGEIPKRNPARKQWWVAGAVLLIVCAIGLGAFIRARGRFAHLSGESTADSSNLHISPLTTAPGNADMPAFSPDGREIAFVWDGPDRKLFDVYVQLLGADMPLRLTYSKGGSIGPPEWSPDGSEIAFERRDSGSNDGVYTVPALGGPERKLISTHCVGWSAAGHPTWTPDEKSMLMLDECVPGGPRGVVLVSLATGGKRCLTAPESASAMDVDNALSPDGRTVAFLRRTTDSVGEIYTIPLSGGAPKRLTSDGHWIVGLMWTPDGKYIVFLSDRGKLPHAWRVPAAGGPIELETLYPAPGSVSKDGRRMAYAEWTGEASSIWRADLTSAGGRVSRTKKVVYSQYRETNAQPSPDGRRIALGSWRTGSPEIWSNSAEGNNPLQLTHLGVFSGTPRWSPDGRWISFDSRPKDHSQIYVVDSEGRNLHPITGSHYESVVPSWSQDGKSIYFASKRSGAWQIWKHSLENGSEARLTERGGFDPIESYDGRTIYYSKLDEAGIWSMPASGGIESLLIADKPQIGYWGYWALTDAGLYLLNFDAEQRQTIEFYNFSTRRISPILSLEEKADTWEPGLSASRDGRTIYYTQFDPQSSIKLVENLR
jgi:Tol biopolymer transport system component/DNA-binding winged helix-turn-helix (wHTH) protein